MAKKEWCCEMVEEEALALGKREGGRRKLREGKLR